MIRECFSVLGAIVALVIVLALVGCVATFALIGVLWFTGSYFLAIVAGSAAWVAGLTAVAHAATR